MSKFILSDKDIESIKANISNTANSFEILKLDDDDYGIFEHIGDNIITRAEFTKQEMRTLWQMLGTNK